VDISEYYAPVENDTVFRIVIVIQLLRQLDSIIMDVETAFLHGESQEDIYMTTPKGINIPKTQCVKLNKALYGLVQAARYFYFKFSKILNELGFTSSYAYPYLFFRTNNDGHDSMIIHVDNCYTIGDSTALNTMQKNWYQRD
jgi:hypothetical protein